jgi:hypothetical protein
MIGGQRTAAAALLVAVFIAGVLGGAAGAKLLDRRPWRPEREHGIPFERMGGRAAWPGGMEGGPDRFGVAPMWLADRLAAQLDLSEEQREEVAAILEARQTRASAALAEMGPFLRAQLDSMNMEIRAVLAPDQQERFDEFVAREDERIFRRGGIPPPDAPPGGSR